MGVESGPSDAERDLALVYALAEGDESALEKLMERHEEQIYHFVYRYLLNVEDAREITQEVFVRLHFNAAKYRPNAKFTTWLFQIALNLCRDYARSRRARQATHTESLSAGSERDDHPEREQAIETRTPSDEASLREKLAALDAGIEALPHDLRAALILSAIEQRSHQECAELLGTTPKGVETRLYRARKKLMDWLVKSGFAALLAACMH